MKRLKYIIFDDCLPVVFGEYYTHKQMVGPRKPTSAGFCSVRSVDGKVVVDAWGESTSLGLKSATDDGAILETLFT